MKGLLFFPKYSSYFHDYPPLGLAYVAGALDEDGHDLLVLDQAAYDARLSTEDLLLKIREFEPDFFALYFNVAYALNNYAIIEAVREIPFHGAIIGGGPHATAMPGELLGHGVDFAVRTEAESPMKDLARHLGGGKPLGDIEGISYLDAEGRRVDNPLPDLRAIEIDSIPFPALHHFEPESYYPGSGGAILYAKMIATRGCPFKCSYCMHSMHEGVYRVRSTENIMREVRHLHEQYRTGVINFVDDTFSIDQAMVRELCTRFIDYDAEIRWRCTTRLDSLEKETVDLMAEAGCERIICGIESIDRETLELVKRNLSMKKAHSTMDYLRSKGISIEMNFLFGFPWDDESSLDAILENIKRYSSRATWIGPHGNIIPLPGTVLYEEYKDKYGYEEWWLDADYGNGYVFLQKQPFYRTHFFEDYGLHNFFDFSKQAMKKMKKITKFIGTANIPVSCNTAKARLFYRLMISLSRILFPISPPLERVVCGAGLRLRHLWNRMSG